MIIGLRQEKRQFTFNEVIQMLNTSNLKFFLTGSRYFNHANDSSDWDFFVDRTSESINFIKGLGFEPFVASELDKFYGNHYEGLSDVTIYQLITIDGKKIQIQLLEGHDASNVKFAVQKNIKDLGTTFTNLPKSERKKVWSAMLNIAWYYLPVQS